MAIRCPQWEAELRGRRHTDSEAEAQLRSASKASTCSWASSTASYQARCRRLVEVPVEVVAPRQLRTAAPAVPGVTCTEQSKAVAGKDVLQWAFGAMLMSGGEQPQPEPRHLEHIQPRYTWAAPGCHPLLGHALSSARRRGHTESPPRRRPAEVPARSGRVSRFYSCTAIAPVLPPPAPQPVHRQISATMPAGPGGTQPPPLAYMAPMSVVQVATAGGDDAAHARHPSPSAFSPVPTAEESYRDIRRSDPFLQFVASVSPSPGTADADTAPVVCDAPASALPGIADAATIPVLCPASARGLPDIAEAATIPVLCPASAKIEPDIADAATIPVLNTVSASAAHGIAGAATIPVLSPVPASTLAGSASAATSTVPRKSQASTPGCPTVLAPQGVPCGMVSAAPTRLPGRISAPLKQGPSSPALQDRSVALKRAVSSPPERVQSSTRVQAKDRVTPALKELDAFVNPVAHPELPPLVMQAPPPKRPVAKKAIGRRVPRPRKLTAEVSENDSGHANVAEPIQMAAAKPEAEEREIVASVAISRKTPAEVPEEGAIVTKDIVDAKTAKLVGEIEKVVAAARIMRPSSSTEPDAEAPPGRPEQPEQVEPAMLAPEAEEAVEAAQEHSATLPDSPPRQLHHAYQIRASMTQVNRLAEEIHSETDLERLRALEPLPDGPAVDRQSLLRLVWYIRRLELNDPELKELDVSGDVLPRDSMILPRLFEVLGCNTHLETLDLTHTGITGLEGGCALASAIARNRTLLVLNISYNSIPPSILQDVFEALGSNTESALEEIRCAGQLDVEQPCRETFQALSKALRTNTKLCKLGMDLWDVYTRDGIMRGLIRNADRTRKERLRRIRAQRQ